MWIITAPCHTGAQLEAPARSVHTWLATKPIPTAISSQPHDWKEYSKNVSEPSAHIDELYRWLKCCVVECRLVLATSKHIAGVLEGPVARLAQPEVSHRIEQAAQGIAWEDWVPLQGGAQYAQGMSLPPAPCPPSNTLTLLFYSSCPPHLPFPFSPPAPNSPVPWLSPCSVAPPHPSLPLQPNNPEDRVAFVYLGSCPLPLLHAKAACSLDRAVGVPAWAAKHACPRTPGTPNLHGQEQHPSLCY